MRGNGLCLIRCNDWEFSLRVQWVGLVVAADVSCWDWVVCFEFGGSSVTSVFSVVNMVWLGLVKD